MKVQFLETASLGLRWMKDYYKHNPQLDHNKAFQKFTEAQTILTEQPHIGCLYEDYTTVRELTIRGSRFSLICTYKYDTIYNIDVRDQRGLRNAIALQEFHTKLKKQYGL